jgi:hypothetical protein
VLRTLALGIDLLRLLVLLLVRIRVVLKDLHVGLAGVTRVLALFVLRTRVLR